MERKNNFFETRTNFRHRKIFKKEQEKFNFVGKDLVKAMAKISVRKLIICDLIRLHFNRKYSNIFMERHSKREFHV